MGIEDFNLDLGEHADRILIITESESSKISLTNLLNCRSYRWTYTPHLSAASQLAMTELFDMVIIEGLDFDISPAQVLASLKADPGLKRSPVIVLHPAPEKFGQIDLTTFGKDVHILKTPFEPSQLIVKLATQLRLRKIKVDQARFDSEVGAQNAQLRDLTTRFKQELKEAQDIQQSILPKRLPYDPVCLFAAKYVPLEAVGGDLYDIWEIEPGRYGFFIGDVTGHGLAAAFIAAMTKMALSYASKADPAIMLSEMNNGMADHIPEGRFITMAAAIYESKTSLLQVARGGHPVPYIWRYTTKTIEKINARGIPLGITSGAHYELYKTTLEPGDKFLMITDGLTETANMKGEMIGTDGIAEFFNQVADTHTIDKCLIEILKKQEKFSGGRILKDDNTLIGLERSLAAKS